MARRGYRTQISHIMSSSLRRDKTLEGHTYHDTAGWMTLIDLGNECCNSPRHIPWTAEMIALLNPKSRFSLPCVLPIQAHVNALD